MSQEAKEREVLQLLKDYRPWHSPFGGAAPTDGTLNLEAQGSYGPAGLIQRGMIFEKEDRKLLAESFGYLEHALTLLKTEHFESWLILLAPYLGDPADPTIVDRWREKHAAWEAERDLIRERHRAWQERRDKKARKKDPEQMAEWEGENPEPERVDRWERANLEPRSAERHDKAISQLAGYLRFKDLYVVSARRMTAEEEKKGEAQNAEIYAVLQRNRNGGLKLDDAFDQTAQDFGVSRDFVERIYEFRHTIKQAECRAEGCDNDPVSQGLCMKHYQQERRAKKGGKRAG